MLRTAAFADILLEHWTGPEVDRKAIVQAAIFHDLAKPMTFDLAKQADFGLSPEEIARLAELQERLKRDYGEAEHQASVKICQEIGCSPKAVQLVDNLEWSYIPRLIKENDLESLVLIYADIRIGPKGVLNIKDRHTELRTREDFDNLEERVQNAENLERLISQNVSIDVNSITNDQVNSRTTSLLSLKVN